MCGSKDCPDTHFEIRKQLCELCYPHGGAICRNLFAKWMKENEEVRNLHEEYLKGKENSRWKTKQSTKDELINSILNQYLDIRIEQCAEQISLPDLKVLLGMLDATTLGDISADLSSYRKENI